MNVSMSHICACYKFGSYNCIYYLKCSDIHSAVMESYIAHVLRLCGKTKHILHRLVISSTCCKLKVEIRYNMICKWHTTRTLMDTIGFIYQENYISSSLEKVQVVV